MDNVFPAVLAYVEDARRAAAVIEANTLVIRETRLIVEADPIASAA